MRHRRSSSQRERSFDPGEVLILLPIPGDPLRARGSGPCVVEGESE